MLRDCKIFHCLNIFQNDISFGTAKPESKPNTIRIVETLYVVT